MDDHRPQSNEKRPNDEIDIIYQLHKRYRSAFDEQQPRSTKIIDLNDDCLMKIFDHLDLSNLFNVAVSNEWLRTAARSVYRRKIGPICVTFDAISYSHCSALVCKAPIQIGPETSIADVKMFLQFLRCFGPSIQNADIYLERLNSKYFDYIDQYINQYCAGTLVSLSYSGNRKFSAANFQKPFVNLESVQLKDADLGDKLPLFVEWFPNLRHLELLDVRVDRNRIKATFNHLEHLSIDINNQDSTIGFSKRNVANLLRLHPQLQSLNIRLPGRQRMTLTTLSNIVRNNPSISTLVMSTCRDYCASSYLTRVKTAELMPFLSALPSLETIVLTRSRFSADDAIAVTRRLNSLKQFSFMFEDDDENYLHPLRNEWHIQSCPNDHINSKPRQHQFIALIRRN